MQIRRYFTYLVSISCEIIRKIIGRPSQQSWVGGWGDIVLVSHCWVPDGPGCWKRSSGF